MKIKVCSQQYNYYDSLPKTSVMLTRLMREFTLSYPQASKLLEDLLETGCEKVFDLFEDADHIPVPAYDGDTRRLFWLPSDQYEWLQARLEDDVGGSYYENLDKMTVAKRDALLRAFEEEFYPGQLTPEDKQKFSQMARQYFLGVRNLDISSSSEATEIIAWIRFQVETGSTVPQAVSEFFRCMSPDVEPVYLASAYSAIAEVLYDEAEVLIQESFEGLSFD